VNRDQAVAYLRRLQGPGHVTVVSRAGEITQALEDHLDLVDADSFAFA